MNKLNPIKYIENIISHHPKTVLLWMTNGIVIDGNRYIIKEFRLKDDKLYAVISDNKYNPEYFEVQLCTDEGTLKDIYKAIEENKIAIEKEVTDRKNEINRVDKAIAANTTKINQEITDRTNEITRVDEAINANTAKINKEITDRQNDINRVDNKITELQGNIKPVVSGNTELLTVTKEESQIKLTPSHDVQKEQVLESTRNTVNIQHGSNGTTEKTTVDTNPQKVLEHENLISDSGYITLDHKTGENTTHIQTARLQERLDYLQQNKQDVLIAGDGIIIAGNTISARTRTTYYTGEDYKALKQVFTHIGVTFSLYTFDCQPQFTERELTGTIKIDLKKFVRAGMTVSNGAISITNDGTTMKLIKSKASENGNQQGIFTFYNE